MVAVIAKKAKETVVHEARLFIINYVGGVVYHRRADSP